MGPTLIGQGPRSHEERRPPRREQRPTACLSAFQLRPLLDERNSENRSSLKTHPSVDKDNPLRQRHTSPGEGLGHAFYTGGCQLQTPKVSPPPALGGEVLSRMAAAPHTPGPPSRKDRERSEVMLRPLQIQPDADHKPREETEGGTYVPCDKPCGASLQPGGPGRNLASALTLAKAGSPKNGAETPTMDFQCRMLRGFLAERFPAHRSAARPLLRGPPHRSHPRSASLCTFRHQRQAPAPGGRLRPHPQERTRPPNPSALRLEPPFWEGPEHRLGSPHHPPQQRPRLCWRPTPKGLPGSPSGARRAESRLPPDV